MEATVVRMEASEAEVSAAGRNERALAELRVAMAEQSAGLETQGRCCLTSSGGPVVRWPTRAALKAAQSEVIRGI